MTQTLISPPPDLFMISEMHQGTVIDNYNSRVAGYSVIDDTNGMDNVEIIQVSKWRCGLLRVRMTGYYLVTVSLDTFHDAGSLINMGEFDRSGQNLLQQRCVMSYFHRTASNDFPMMNWTGIMRLFKDNLYAPVCADGTFSKIWDHNRIRLVWLGYPKED